jgi:hypothetical protein
MVAPSGPLPGQAKPAEQNRFRLLALILPAVLAAVVAFAAGIGIGAAGRDTTTPEPTVTVTQTVEGPVDGGGTPTEEPTQEPSTEPTEATYNPKRKDFKIAINVLKKTCYGELGCDVYFRIVPSYVGSQSFPAEGTTEVTYEVTGGKDPITNTFKVDGDGTVTFDEEESAEIASPSRKLVAKVTDVAYNKFG